MIDAIYERWASDLCRARSTLAAGSPSSWLSARQYEIFFLQITTNQNA